MMALKRSTCFTYLWDGEDYSPGTAIGNKTHEAENKDSAKRSGLV
jgi:hypothetical protein